MSLSTLEASLIYSAKNGHQWAANGILFIQKKLKSCKSAPSIHKQQSMLAGPLAALATPTKVQSSFQSNESESETNVSLHKNTTVKIAICASAVTLLWSSYKLLNIVCAEG